MTHDCRFVYLPYFDRQLSKIAQGVECSVYLEQQCEHLFGVIPEARSVYWAQWVPVQAAFEGRNLKNYYYFAVQLSQLCSKAESRLTMEDFTACIFELSQRSDGNSLC